jgi:hypothetical protein
MTDVEDYPPTGSYTMGPEELANADTQRAWSVPPQPQPYYDESPYQKPPHQDWAGTVKLVSGHSGGGSRCRCCRGRAAFLAPPARNPPGQLCGLARQAVVMGFFCVPARSC